MLQAWPLVRARLPEATLHVFIGWGKNKVPGHLLQPGQAGPGVVVNASGLPHDVAIGMLRQSCDLGVRGVAEDQAEHQTGMVSTKLIEMAGTALPVVLNPLPIHSHLLGQDYPLFWPYRPGPVNRSFADAVIRAFTVPRDYEQASHSVLAMARRFTVDAIAAQLPPLP